MELDAFFGLVNKMNPTVLLRILRSEVRIDDLPEIYRVIHSVVPVITFIERLSPDDRNMFIEKAEIYLEDELNDAFNKRFGCEYKKELLNTMAKPF